MQTTYYTPSRRRSIAYQNGTAEKQPQQSSSEFDKLIKANTTLAIWLIFLAIGGGLLALYYSQIKYLPEIEWKAALIYLFIGSVVGGVIGLLLTMSLYLPGVIWCELMVFDPTLDDYFSYKLKNTESRGSQSTRKEPCIRSIMSFLGLPFFWALLTSHLALRVSTWLQPFPKLSTFKFIDLYWVVAAVILILTFYVIRKIFEEMLLEPGSEGKEEVNDQDRETITRQIFKYSCWFTLSVLLNQISMYLIYRLANRTPDLFDFIILTAMCTAAVWISTHVVATRHRDYPRQAIVASLVAAGLLLFMADNYSSLSVKLMNYYGIGYNQKFNVLVNDDGSKLLGGLGVAKCGTDKLYEVEILSKVGDEYFLKVADNTFVTLPKKDVLAVSPLR